MDYHITVDNEASQEEINFLIEGIDAYNFEAGGIKHQALNIFVRDEKNNIVGGLTGGKLANGLYIHILYLNKTLRQKGYGTKLMQLAEEYARTNGCTFIHLDTFSFQALPFYKKLGYKIFGELTYDAGVKRYYLKKDIV